MAQRRYYIPFFNIRRRPSMHPSVQWRRQASAPSMMAGVGTLQADTRNGVFANHGYGGGVFNYNVAFGHVDSTPRSLGQDDPRHPWRAFSHDTLAMQTVLNQEITGQGLCPITVDGRLGPQTCGAVDWTMDFTSRPPVSTCESHRSEGPFPFPQSPPCPTFEAPEPPPVVVVPPPTPQPPAPPPQPPPEPPPEPPPTPAKTGTAGILVLSGALLVLAGTVAIAGSKRKGR